MSAQILFVGECRLFLEGLARALVAQGQFESMGVWSASDLEHPPRSGDQHPRIVLLEVSNRFSNAVSLLEAIRLQFPQARTVVVLKSANSMLLRTLLEAGAASCVQEDQPLEDLVHAIEMTAEGQSYLAPKLSRQLLANVLSTAEKSPVEKLSPRERTVLLLLLQGRSNKEIALRLGLSVRTVETHRAHVMSKLGVHSIAELFQFAVQHELLSQAPPNGAMSAQA